MAGHGTATIDFGAFPGAVQAQVDVTGQTGLVATSRIESWVMSIATADHTVDEHMVESLLVRAVYQVDGTLTVKGVVDPGVGFDRVSQPAQQHRLHGQFSVGWAWA